MKGNKVIIGTRSSDLAVGQAEIVAEMLGKAVSEYEFELEKIKTKGDKILDSPLSQVGGKGLFIKELEVSLLEEEIDLAVHSMKDMPAELPEGLAVLGFPERVDSRDALVSNGDRNLDELPTGARIGTGSLRRTSQLLNYRPDLEVVPIRGNINTRLEKLTAEELNLDAIVLAAAGLIRMGWKDKITEYLDDEVMLPAAGQGALAIEAREDDEEIKTLINKIDDQRTRYILQAERGFLERLDGDCQVPIGALAEIEGEEITLEGMVATLDGQKHLRDQITGSVGEAEELGIELAEELIAKGAEKILQQARQETDK
ncbi:hydroxymethylbilane synthase [Acetohalobium arabaticum]|uniref:Porphobilinogen deaminase n=1 Tax=Acetohalobium arabaticum (strain ATCC 49924 / DSM 5501 / Z-7288) TaxID=574087 RepID=D9QV27_ACEAZ|nr:hydroxymethylbilane synthase [Acetohalobium arabaticum]ADL12086.1 hydroxymethylbilane synthase [Acetohalobium arabaticum DSM 5501]